jgi:hypothetical protein
MIPLDFNMHHNSQKRQTRQEVANLQLKIGYKKAGVGMSVLASIAVSTLSCFYEMVLVIVPSRREHGDISKYYQLDQRPNTARQFTSLLWTAASRIDAPVDWIKIEKERNWTDIKINSPVDKR